MQPDAPTIAIEQLDPSAELPQSPPLPDDRPAVAIRILPASHADRPTFAVLGAVNLTERQSLLYGPEARQVLRLVAFDPRTGRVFHADIAGAHAPALGPVGVFSPPPPPRAPNGGALPTGFGFNFNLDLVSRLNLPGDAARYTIVAWIEDLVSEPHAIDLPEDKARFPARPFIPEPSVSSPVHVRKTDRSPPQRKNAITVRAGPPTEGAERAVGRVYASIGPGVLPAVPEGVEGAPKHVAVLAQTALDRRLAVRTIRLPGVVFDPTGAGEFDFEAAELFPPNTERQPIFVIVMAGQHVSEALTLLPPGWKD